MQWSGAVVISEANEFPFIIISDFKTSCHYLAGLFHTHLPTIARGI